MMYTFILMLIIPSMVGYAGCTSDHNPTPGQQAVVQQQQNDSLLGKKVPEMPKVSLQVPPVYPEEARKKGIQGVVEVQILVGTDGLVKEATVINNKTGSKELEKAALDALYKWKFEPGKLDGKPIQVHAIIPIKFKLDDKGK